MGKVNRVGADHKHLIWVPPPRGRAARHAVTATAIGKDGPRGHIPGLDENVAGTAPNRPGPRTLAPDRPPAHPPPRHLQLHRRDPDRRHHAQTMQAPLCRLRPPLAVRDLPRQPRRLLRISLPPRPAHRHLPASPRHRLRPLPQRPNRLDLTPDELTGKTT